MYLTGVEISTENQTGKTVETALLGMKVLRKYVEICILMIFPLKQQEAGIFSRNFFGYQISRSFLGKTRSVFVMCSEMWDWKVQTFWQVTKRRQ